MKIIAKTCSYSIMHVLVAISVAYIISGDIYIALGIGLIEPVIQTFFYFIHENIWKNIKLKTFAGKKLIA